MHAAVFLVLIASLKIFAQRAISQNLAGGIANTQNLPLAAVTLIPIVLLELFQKRLNRITFSLAILSCVTYFVSSFYLPVENRSHELASLPAYASLLLLLSIGLVAAAFRNPGTGKALVGFFTLGLISLAGGFLYTFSDLDVLRAGQTADAAVVLGGAVWGPHTPSPDLKARLDAAAELYEKGEAKKIAVTGGTRRFNTFESEIAASYLRAKGIPGVKILTEHNTLNTLDQIRYVKDVLIDSLRLKKVVIVSDNWHLPRAMAMCKWEKIRAICYPSHYKMSLQSELYWRSREAAGLQIFLLFGA